MGAIAPTFTNKEDMFRKLALITLLSFTLSGCGMIGFTDANHSNHGMMDVKDSDFSGKDIMFAQMMIPHHQQAVDMGTLAETRALDSEVLAIALAIKAEQAPEIALMKSWLVKAGQPEDSMHQMDMGMLNQSEYKALEDSSGKEFDILYLQGMIKHHEGAIDMAETVENSSNTEVRNLAKSIIASQTDQIETLKQLLTKVG